MNNYINPIPDFNKHVSEAEDFLQRLTDNRFATEKWSLFWKNLREVYINSIKLEKKWIGYKQSTGINPKRMIKTDLDNLVHRLDVDIFENESAIEWGIRSSQSMIDEFSYLFPYLLQTDFNDYIEEIRTLLESVINRTKHSEVMKLLREFRKHPDLVVIGQFATNEMVEYYKHLRDSSPPNTRNEIIKYIDIYQKFCGIYEKDMILCYCLLQLRERGVRPTYEEAHSESRNFQDRNNYVKRRINSFGMVYDPDLRNAVAHNDIETDSNKQMVTIYTGRGKRPKSCSYEQIVSITRGISALIIAFRLLVIVLANSDWRTVKALLQ